MMELTVKLVLGALRVNRQNGMYYKYHFCLRVNILREYTRMFVNRAQSLMFVKTII